MLSVQCTVNIQAELSRVLEKEHPVLSEITGNTVLLQLARKNEKPPITLVNTLRLSLCFSLLSSITSGKFPPHSPAQFQHLQ